MNYNALITAIYDVASEYNIEGFINPVWIEITGEDEESVEYLVHHAPMTAKGLYMLQSRAPQEKLVDIYCWDGYKTIGSFDTEKLSITFFNPFQQ